MIYLKDILNEASLTPYQIFAPGTGGAEYGNMKFNPSKIPTGQLKIYSAYDFGGQCVNKPHGCFWTSSYKEKLKGSEWTDYKKKKFPTWHSSMGAVFKVKSGAKILKIRNHKDYMKVQKKFPMRVECPSGELYLNWQKVSKKYDAVQLTNTDYVPMLGQWDVESTAWFNMKKLEFVGTTKV